jgi:hypothetical protein
MAILALALLATPAYPNGSRELAGASLEALPPGEAPGSRMARTVAQRSGARVRVDRDGSIQRSPGLRGA